MSLPTQPGKQQVGAATEGGPPHQDPNHPKALAQGPAQKCAAKGHQDTKHLRDPSDFVLGKSHVNIKRIRHDAHDQITDAVNADERQQCHGFLQRKATEEFLKRGPHHILKPSLEAFLRWSLGCGLLGRTKASHHPHHDGQGHGRVGALPGQLAGRWWAQCDFCWQQVLRPGRNPQGACTRPNHSQSVTGLVHGGQRGLVFEGGRFDPVGVQCNILRGRGQGDKHGTHDQGAQMGLRRGVGHEHQSSNQGALSQQQPGSSPTQSGTEQEDALVIHQGRPKPLEGVGQAHPT